MTSGPASASCGSPPASTPVPSRSARRSPIGAEEDFEAALRAAGRARRGAAGPRPRPAGARATSSSPSRTRTAVDLRGEDRAGRAAPRPGPAGGRAGGEGARADPARRRLPRDCGDGERLGVRRARGGRGELPLGELGRVRGRAPARLRRRGAAARGRPAAPAASRWPPTPTCAATRCRARERGAPAAAGSPRPAPSPSRRPGDLRGRRLHRARLPRRGRPARARAAATAPRPSASPTAPCSAAAPATSRSSGWPERSTRLLDPPVLAALRLGLYELLFADATPDHAAVDQAVELAKAGGAAHAAGFVNAVLRRAVRERDAAASRAARATTRPRRCGGRRFGAAVAGGDVVAGARRRRRRADCSPPATEPAEVAMRVNAPARRPRGRCSRALREAGVEAQAAEAPGRSAAPEAIVIARAHRRGGPGRGRGRRADAAEPRLGRRGRGARPAARRARPRPLRRPRDQDRPDRRADGRPRRGDLGRARPGAGRRGRRPGEPPRPARRHRDRGRRRARRGSAPGFDRVLLDAPCSDLGTLASRPDARWRKSPEDDRRLAEVQDAAAARGRRRAPARRHARLLDLHDLPPRERGPGRRAARARPRRARCRRWSSTTSAPLAPALASPAERRCLQLRPDRDLTTGFFIARLRTR